MAVTFWHDVDAEDFPVTRVRVLRHCAEYGVRANAAP